MADPFKTPLRSSTRFCAVFGHPVRHSASPALQNAGLAALGLNWRYLACEVHPDQLAAAIEGAKAMRFIGLNLTLPHKLLALGMVDALDESAKMWGAVNTIRFEALDAGGRWVPMSEIGTDDLTTLRSNGFNTDADAFARSLKEDLHCEARGSRILLLGAGGAARAAAVKLAADGAAELFIANRTASKAEELAAEIRQRFPQTTVATGYPLGPVDLLINATSLGLKPDDASPLDTSKFRVTRARAVYDMIYSPAETALLTAAKAAGCRVANGFGMLLHQGARALEIWTCRPSPMDAMRGALKEEVYGS